MPHGEARQIVTSFSRVSLNADNKRLTVLGWERGGVGSGFAPSCGRTRENSYVAVDCKICPSPAATSLAIVERSFHRGFRLATR